MTRKKIDRRLAPLLPRYIARLRDDVRDLRRAAAAGDFDAARFTGHRMAGSGGGFGLPEVSDIGRAIEAAARASETGAIVRWAEALESFLAALEVEFD